MRKIALVTGGSSGIGKAAAQALLARGFGVYTLSRNPSELPGATHICADVTDEDGVHRAVLWLLSQAGRLDLVVNCAGFGIAGAAEFTKLADAKQQLDVNFFGTVNVCRAALSPMRDYGGGRIINVSSVAGSIPIPFQTYYSVSKAAINSYTMALANEVRPFGISVCAIEPGDICTGFTGARRKVQDGDDVYDGRIARSVEGMERDERRGMKPERIGKAIAALACKKRVRPLCTVGAQYHVFLLLAKLLPAAALNRLVGRIYAK